MWMSMWNSSKEASNSQVLLIVPRNIAGIKDTAGNCCRDRRICLAPIYSGI